MYKRGYVIKKLIQMLITLLLLAFVFAACESPMGPEGPQGEQGPQGENKAKDNPVIDPGLVGIETSQLPNRLTYLMGEQLDLTGLQVTAVFSDGTVGQTSNYSIVYNTFTAGSASVNVISRQDSAITSSFTIEVLNTLVDTGLPVIYIDTQDAQPITSKDDYINGTIIIKQDYRVLYEEQTMRIRGRGNSTWTHQKKPYRIKLDKATDFFGMGSDRDWALLANFCDKTLLRTGIAFHLSKAMNFPWTPDAKFVELVLNGHYLGNYQLVEHVKQSSQRVNVSNAGYIIQVDNYYQQEPKWFVTDLVDGSWSFGYSFKHPDYEDLTEEQFSYIENYMNEFESILTSGEFNTGYQKYIDLDSFVRWFLFQNIIANLDTNPYIYKYDNTANSKLHMGPVWDFDWSMGIGWYDGPRPRPAGYWVWNHWYYSKLLTDTAFVNALQTLWNANKTTLQREVLNYIAEAKREIYESQKVNFRRWDVLNTKIGSVGAIPLGSFDAEVACDVQFFNNHFDWLDSAINGLVGQTPAIPETPRLMIFQVYGTGTDTDGAVSHSFVELYNNSNADIDLSNYSLHYANGHRSSETGPVDSWTRLDLSGTIPSGSSYLIIGQKKNLSGRYQINGANADFVSDFVLSNRAFKVALMSNRSDISTVNPFNTDGYVDMVSVINSGDIIDAYEGAVAEVISKQAAARRGSLIDSDNNKNDFVRIDYRTTELNKFRPRSMTDSSWVPQF